MALECRSLHEDYEPHNNVFRRDSPQHFVCYVCKVKDEEYVESYYCSTCKEECHIGCYKFRLRIKNHPYHPSHTLTLKNLYDSNSSIPNSSPYDKEEVISSPDEDLGGCKCCRRKIQDMYYHCSECNFTLNATCALNPPPPTISNPKRHGDTIFTLFPRRISSPCDACGESLNNTSDHVYTCLSLNYIAHGKCIKKLPCVIKITRHSHRLSHTNSLFSSSPPPPPSDGFSCGVCYKSIKVNYGQYSCPIKDCHYVVHSKCATRDDVWDGKDLKGVPEEPEEYGDPFERIDEETIQYFSHDEHLLKFYGEKNGICDGSKFCEACLLLIVDSNSLYSCMECDFILHEACVSLPRKIGHQLHKHSLTLLPVPTNLYLTQFMVFVQGMFKCSGCHQRGYGFMYQCSVKGCKFQVDLRCASLAQSFIHGSHNHPLFLSLTKGECMRCGSNQCSPFYLECTRECKFFLGLKCATLPDIAHYKYDRHPLTLCYGEKGTTSGHQYWCELCEAKLDAREWFYTCDNCRVTLHVSCLLGKEVFMKPNHGIKINDNEVDIVPNNNNPRPFCDKCGDRCVDTMVFKRIDRYCCTLDCMKKSLDRERREKEQKGGEEKG